MKKQSSWFIFLYFVMQLLMMIIYQDMLMLIIGFVSSGLLFVVLLRQKKVGRKLTFICVVMTVTFVLNPLFNHRGTHILFYFLQNPVTAESFVAGARAALIMGEMLLLFGVFQESMTSEDWQEIMGKYLPQLGLLFSLILSLCPRLTRKFTQVKSYLKLSGETGINKKALEQFVSFSMEDAIGMSISMKARGYGLKGRTYFQKRAMTWQEKISLAVLIVLGVSSLCVANAVVYVAFVNLPVVLMLKEELVWNYYKQKI